MLEKSLVPIVLLLIAIFGATTVAQTYTRCRTSTNATGKCVPLTNCPTLEAASRNDLHLIRQNRCRDTRPALHCCASTEIAFKQLPTTCGISFNSRIVGGEDATPDEYPWLALLKYNKSNNRTGFHCGGSLINKRYVLTAAHCINGQMPSTWTLVGVRLGEFDLTAPELCGDTECAVQELDFTIIESVSHPNYNAQSLNQADDIGLLRLDRDVPDDLPHISPICLPLADEYSTMVISNKELFISGWGKTSNESASKKKQTAMIFGIDHRQCRKVYQTQNIVVTTKQVCAGGIEGVDTCRGDSGGPLMSKELSDGVEINYIMGIVSFGPSPCGQKNWPGIYTRVDSYIGWIVDSLKL